MSRTPLPEYKDPRFDHIEWKTDGRVARDSYAPFWVGTAFKSFSHWGFIELPSRYGQYGHQSPDTPWYKRKLR